MLVCHRCGMSDHELQMHVLIEHQCCVDMQDGRENSTRCLQSSRPLQAFPSYYNT